RKEFCACGIAKLRLNAPDCLGMGFRWHCFPVYGRYSGFIPLGIVFILRRHLSDGAFFQY
ncbi:hypothetical protein OIG01_00790, partial [Neisseria meningitidis]|nr:hypothetical protein [Neisseria meningitidis]